MDARPSFGDGLGEALLMLAGFVAFGLLAAAGEAAYLRAADPYTVPVAGARDAESSADTSEPGAPAGRLWLVDGFNVLHAGVLQGRDRAEWWKAPGREKLIDVVRRFDQRDAEIWLVFDGQRPADSVEPEAVPGPRIRTVFAPDADRWLVQRASEPDATRLTVVTGDRQLAERVKHRGVAVLAPQRFLSRCRHG